MATEQVTREEIKAVLKRAQEVIYCGIFGEFPEAEANKECEAINGLLSRLDAEEEPAPDDFGYGRI